MMVNPNSFTAGVVSSAGSYIIKIDNATTFASYGESHLKNNQWQNFEGEYMAQAQFLISVMGMSRDAAYETALASRLANTGMSLYKMEGSSNWKKIESSNGITSSYTNCP